MNIVDNYLSELRLETYDRYKITILSHVIKRVRIPDRLSHVTPINRADSIVKDKAIRVNSPSSRSALDPGLGIEGIYLTDIPRKLLNLMNVVDPVEIIINTKGLKKSKFMLDPEFYEPDPDNFERGIEDVIKEIKNDGGMFLIYRDNILFHHFIDINWNFLGRYK